LLPHDLNIDLFIMTQDAKKLFDLFQLNFSSSYKLKVHPQWFLVG
jgi:phosphorylcholine metabolism protein LicD